MKHPWTTDRALRARAAHLIYTAKKKGLPMPTIPNTVMTLNVEVFIGLTPWKNAAEEPPPCTGWWKTRRVSSPKLLQPQRRWFDGRKFSKPVMPVDDDEYAEDMAGERCDIPASDLEWCGLRESYPCEAYPYRPIFY